MKTSLSLITLAVLSSTSFANDIAATALPQKHSIKQGDATISQIDNAMTIDQKSDRVSIDWESFNIGKQASVTFKQPDSSSIAYNRVTGADVSTIQGKLNANGRVFLSNPNGVIFTKDAQVNVGAILATTKEVEKLADKPTRSYPRDEANFKRKKDQEGEIRNEGKIQAEEAIYLVGDKVVNNGELRLTGNPEEVIKLNYSGNLDGIEVKNKTVLLGAGDSFTFDLANFSISLTGKQVAGLIENKGAIISNDRILLTAKGEDQLKHSAVNNAGLLEANDIAIEGGKIVLTEQSDIRYGKDSRNAASLKITQVGRDKDAGVKIAGKITALAQTDKVKQATYDHNDRFKQGSLALDENGNVLYTADKKTVAKAEKTDQGLKTAEGQVYTYQKDGVLTISASNGGYKVVSYGWQPVSNQKVDALQLPYINTILSITYKENNGVISDLKVTANKEDLDPVNQKIVEKVQQQIDSKDYSFLEVEKLNALTASIVEEQKQALIKKTGISEEQLALLSGEQSTVIDGYTYKTSSYLLKSNVDKVLSELNQKNKEVKQEDITLLAALLNNRRQAIAGEDNYKSKSGYFNDEKQQIYPLSVNASVAEKLRQSVRLPLTTISSEAGIDVQNANFTHSEGGQHNVIAFANNPRDTELNIRIADTQIDLGGGSFGIGSQSTFTPLKEEVLQVREENGKLIPLYSLKGKSSLQQKTLKELLANVKFYEDFVLDLETKDQQKITSTELWKKFVENPTALEGKNLDQQNFFTVVKNAFNDYAKEYFVTVPSQLGTLLSRSTFSDGSSINSSWLKIETAKQVNEIPGLTAQQYAPFNVLLNNVNIKQSKDFVIADGFKNVTFDRVNTAEEIGLYINAGNQRVYASQATNLSEKEQKQGYEYLIANLEERVMRGNFSVLNERYNFSDYNWDSRNQPLKKERSNSDRATIAANRELSRAFAEWAADRSDERSHIDGTKITIRNSQLNSKEGFTHLLAKDIDINNSRLAVDYAQPLYDSFMPYASKIGLNAQHIRLDNSQLWVSGADKLGASATPRAAGIFIIGDLVGRNSEIYAKTYQGYTISTGDKTVLKGETTPQDLRITAIHTGPYPQDNGSVFGPNPADYFIDGIGFSVEGVVIRDEAGNMISSPKTTLDNVVFNIFAPNGARAFESRENTKSPNITVLESASFNYFERPRVVGQGYNQVTGKSNAVSLRDMLHTIDRIQGIQASNLGLQQTSNAGTASSLDSVGNVIQNNSLPEDVSDIEICGEADESCRELPIKMNGEVSVGELL